VATRVAMKLVASRAAVLCLVAASPPIPNERQLAFMDLETTQFMHFGIDTHWKPPTAFLHGKNPTYHNCGKQWSGLSNDSQTEGYWPCLNPKIVTFDKLDTESWMEASAALGMKEVCLTAKHEGGYTMWPSQHTPYGVQSSMNFRGGKGDVLKDFAASARKWGIKICYYCNPMTDGYLAQIAKVDEDKYMASQKGMLTELLAPDSPYGPVNRLWFDGVKSNSKANGDFRPGYLGDNYTAFYTDVYEHIRKVSPSTLISSKRGDVCDNTASLYTNDGPAPNSTDSSQCTTASVTGQVGQGGGGGGSIGAHSTGGRETRRSYCLLGARSL
jgi:alpha-L-fucosidase